MDRRSPARVLVVNRRLGEQLGVTQLARELGDAPEGVDGLLGVSASLRGVAQSEERLRPLARAGDPELERRPVPGGRVLECEGGGGGLGGEQVVLDRALQAADGSARRIVVRQRRESRATVAARAPARQRLGDEQVGLRLPGRRQPVGDRPADELVDEAVRERRPRLLDEETAERRLVQRAEEAVGRDDRRLAKGLEVELGTGDRSELEHGSRLGRVARESLAHDLPDRRRRAELGCRPDEARVARACVDRAGVDQLTPELGDEERVAARQLGDRRVQLVRGLDPGRESDELPELGVGEPTEPDPDDALAAGDVDERVGEARA